MALNAHRTFIQVKEKIYLGPNYVRIIFDCADVEKFKYTSIGDNNKIFIPRHDQTAIEIPDFDFNQRKWIVSNPEMMPEIRTYTHRDIDLVNKTLTIEFAMHGTDTVACHWADRAQPGDQIGVTMSTAAKNSIPTGLNHYLIITDGTGLAVTQAILEKLTADAKVYVIVEVATVEDQIELHTQADLEQTWLFNPNPLQQSLLADELLRHPEFINLPASRFAHITAELQAVRACRNILRKQSDWGKEDCYACSYWQIGKADNERQSKVLDD
ncbi:MULTISPECIES: siderophore-interacting protein [Acinetobacter]|uniref:siderophore-interacting protein n=1 Tax=Acinetobacter TaxID=469 RepID=UPI0022E22277|nr:MULTISPECIES: siderophore-interacting protein [Acinetobacter]MDI1222825.1 siderophore-interacting protein [Acinetobacter sp.]